MKKTKIMVVFLLISCLLTACTSLPKGTFIDLEICGSYSVPGMYSYDLKGVECTSEVLEEDTEGRILFTYSAFNHISGKREQALVICQKIDSKYVYFYEDKCYLLPGYAESDIEGLKADNDWGEALDESKMSRRSSKITFDQFILTDTNLDYQTILTVAVQKADVEASQVQAMIFMDASPYGQELYLLQIERNGEQELYFVIAKPFYVVSLLKIEDETVDIDALAAFKQESGWGYGF